MNFDQKLKGKLKQNIEFWDEKADDINRNEIINRAYKVNKDLIGILIDDKEIRDTFFDKIKEYWVFNIYKFVDYIENIKVKKNGYTKFKQTIGLNIDGKSLNERGEVSLVWPFKDCVLEGGMTKEDQKRNEIFFNEILAKDEIDRLFDAKVLTNFKKYTAKGEEKVKDFNRDEKGTIKENFIIKGNNLLALHSLKKQFAGKVKLIYIDPPYNPPSSNNTFTYNNNFNHSTWLTFMKNRLDVGKKLLSENGAFIVAIDENEVHYLGIMIEELFPEYENHCVTIVHNPRGVIGTNFSYTHEYAYFIFPKGKKVIGNRKIKEEDVSFSNLRTWGGESERHTAKNCFYPIIIDKCTNQVIDFGEVCKDDIHPPVNIHKGDFVEIYPVDKNGIERKWRYARQSVDEIKDLLRVRENKGVYDIQIGKDFGTYRTVWVDKRYDANEYGTKIVNSLVKDNTFSFPKSLWNVYDCIYAVVGDDKNAIVLDYHAGSGTTAHAVLELNKEDHGNRKFILIEQMDYINTVTCPRVQKVMELNAKEKNLNNFNKNESFIYCELLKYNEEAIDKIQDAKDTKSLLKIWKEMVDKYFLNYDVKIHDFDYSKFEKMTLKQQKDILVKMLNKNQLYVNLTEIEDSQFKVSKEDKELNKKFYGGK